MPCPFCHNRPKSKIKQLLLHWKAILRIYNEKDHSLTLMIHNVKTGNFTNEWRKEKKRCTNGQPYLVVDNINYRGLTIFDDN